MSDNEFLLPPLEQHNFVRLGHVSLSDNTGTDYKSAREFKSIHLDNMATALCLRLHKNHVNAHNLYNQVKRFVRNVTPEMMRNWIVRC